MFSTDDGVSPRLSGERSGNAAIIHIYYANQLYNTNQVTIHSILSIKIECTLQWSVENLLTADIQVEYIKSFNKGCHEVSGCQFEPYSPVNITIITTVHSQVFSIHCCDVTIYSSQNILRHNIATI